MANTINLFKQYIPVLDELYKAEAKSAILDGANDLARMGYNANEMVIPKMSTSGLSDYSRATGYATGDVTITYDDDADTYDVFIESEKRHIVVPRRYTEVVASDHSNAVIEEYNTGETKIIFYFAVIYWNMN